MSFRTTKNPNSSIPNSQLQTPRPPTLTQKNGSDGSDTLAAGSAGGLNVGRVSRLASGGNSTTSMSSPATLAGSNTTTSTSSSTIIQESSLEIESLESVLSEVPWLQLRIVATPDLSVFARDKRLQAYIQRITQKSVETVSKKIVEEFRQKLTRVLDEITETVDTRMESVKETVIDEMSSITSLSIVGSQTSIGNLIIIPDTPDIIIPIPGPGPLPPTPTPGPNVNPCPPTFPDQAPAMIDAPVLNKAKWIWSQDVRTNATPPKSQRMFRFVQDFNCPVNFARIVTACDNFYTLYVNGKLVGSGKAWNVPDEYTVRFEETTKVVVAIYAAQDPDSKQQVGLIASGTIWNSQEQEPKGTEIVTDATWKTLSTDMIKPDFMKMSFDDSSWEQAAVVTDYGGYPWVQMNPTRPGDLAKKGLSGLTGVEDAPMAPPANVETK